MTRVAVLVGSLRSDSINRKLAEHLHRTSPEGVTVDLIDGLSELPFYNEDIDVSPVPAAAQALRDRVAAADRILVITPEYNGNLPAVVGNSIDWLSRPYGAGAIVGKPFAVVGATPTPYGGTWAHQTARRSAQIAGATLLEEAELSQGGADHSIASDADFLGRLDAILQSLIEAEVTPAA